MFSGLTNKIGKSISQFDELMKFMRIRKHATLRTLSLKIQ